MLQYDINDRGNDFMGKESVRLIAEECYGYKLALETVLAKTISKESVIVAVNAAKNRDFVLFSELLSKGRIDGKHS